MVHSPAAWQKGRRVSPEGAGGSPLSLLGVAQQRATSPTQRGCGAPHHGERLPSEQDTSCTGLRAQRHNGEREGGDLQLLVKWRLQLSLRKAVCARHYVIGVQTRWKMV